MVRALLCAARLVLWGFLAYGVWMGSRVVLVIALAVVFFAVELLIATSPVVISLRPVRARHRRGSDGEE